MRTILFAVLAGMTLAFTGCRRTDVRDFVLDVPQMKAEDLQAVSEALMGKPQYVTDSSKRKVLVGYEGGFSGLNELNEPGSLGFTEPSRNLKFDPATHRLSMRYDSMQIAKVNIAMAVAKLGFDVSFVDRGVTNRVSPESIGAKRR